MGNEIELNGKKRKGFLQLNGWTKSCVAVFGVIVILLGWAWKDGADKATIKAKVKQHDEELTLNGREHGELQTTMTEVLIEVKTQSRLMERQQPTAYRLTREAVADSVKNDTVK